MNHLSASLPTPQGQLTKVEFWVDDYRKIIKIAVPAQGVIYSPGQALRELEN